MSRLRQGEDVFTLDRLIDAAANIGVTVRMHDCDAAILPRLMPRSHYHAEDYKMTA